MTIPRWLCRLLRGLVRAIDTVGVWTGYLASGLFLFLLGLLVYGLVSNAVFKSPAIWLMEMAQFTMAAYYTLGGAYTLQRRSHVRMDLLYGRWSSRTRMKVDIFTGLILMAYLACLVWGGVESSLYALEYNQKNYSAWAPPLAPVKIIITTGIFLMLLQAFSIWVKDVARVMRKRLG